MFFFLHNHNHWPGTAVEQRGDLWIWSHQSFNDSLYQFQAGGGTLFGSMEDDFGEGNCCTAKFSRIEIKSL